MRTMRRKGWKASTRKQETKDEEDVRWKTIGIENGKGRRKIQNKMNNKESKRNKRRVRMKKKRKKA